MKPGELAIVLHTHMPYVEGFGTWPFGEEWLWEAIATCYLPLLGVLGTAPLTLSLTPVLCDQLEAPGAIERGVRFLSEIRPESHRLDIEELRGQRRARRRARALGRRIRAGRRALRVDRPVEGARRARDLDLRRDSPRATPAGDRRRDRGSGPDRGRVASEKVRRWEGGFWMPECAYAPWLDAPGGGGGAVLVRRADRPLPVAAIRGTYTRSRPTRGRCCGRSTARRCRSCGARRGTRRRAYRDSIASPPTTIAGGRTTGAPTTRCGGRARQRARPGLRRARAANGSATAAFAYAPLTPSCSATGGTRACIGSRPWSTRRRQGLG